MTTDVLRLPGDYRIEAKSSSSTSVTIDSPTTIINGNLNVIGTVTNIVTTNTNISDNILTLNSGETNPYVTRDVSGILIARGNNDNPNSAATLLYNDNTSSGGAWTIGTDTTRGIFEFTVENKTSAIRANAIRIGNNVNKLNFLGENSTATLSVSGTYNYEDYVLDDDDIPNLKYVRDYLNINQVEFAKKLRLGTAAIELNSDAVLITDPYYAPFDRMLFSLATSTNIVLKLEGTQAIFHGITLNNNSISATTPGSNIVLDAVGSGAVIVNNSLGLLNISQPSPQVGITKIYTSSAVGGGGTGINYINTNDADELVSRRRAIVYGIIF
jgi:hypothetical protein